MKEYHLNPSVYKFLVLLNYHEGCSQCKLSHILSINEALATRAMKNLIDLKYIIRKKEKDNRKYSLYLTEEGRKIVTVLEERLQFFWDNVLSDLSNEEKEFFYKTLETMVEIIIAGHTHFIVHPLNENYVEWLERTGKKDFRRRSCFYESDFPITPAEFGRNYGLKQIKEMDKRLKEKILYQNALVF